MIFHFVTTFFLRHDVSLSSGAIICKKRIGRNSYRVEATSGPVFPEGAKCLRKPDTAPDAHAFIRTNEAEN